MAYSFDTFVDNSANNNVLPATTFAAGATIVLFSSTTTGGGTPTITVSDDKGGTWVTTTVNNTTVSAGWRESVAYCLSAPGGSTIITVTYNGGPPGSTRIRAVSWKGANGTYLGITSVSTTNGTGTDAIASNALNVTTQPALFIGLNHDTADNTGQAAGTGFTLRGTANILCFEDKRVTATGNTTATFTNATHGSEAQVTWALGFSEPGIVFAPIQSAVGNAIGTTSFTVQLTGVTAGSLLTLHVGLFTGSSGNNSVRLSTPPDTNGSWQLATTAFGNNSGGLGSCIAGIAFSTVAAAGTHTVTVSAFGFTISKGHAILVEWPGNVFGSTTAVDVAGSTNATTAQSNTVTSTGATTTAVEAVFASFAYIPGAGVANAGITDPPSGFTSLYVQQVTNAGDIGIEHAYKLTSSPGVQSAPYTWTDGTTTLSQAVIVALSSSNTVYTPFSQTIFFVQDRVVPN